MKKLPIGINTFSSIRDNDMVYIDKTPLMEPMVDGPGRFFLSRPRRFGKSLLLDTFKELFEGNRRLFADLYIEDKWDWGTHYPVLRFDFADGWVTNKQELDSEIRSQLRLQYKYHDLTPDDALISSESVSALFRSLILAVEEKHLQKVVILIDEYDKPILDNIEQPEQAAEIRDTLKGFYSVMKGQDAHIQFIFMTGVTKFSKVSLFSGINQIQDITLDQRYATLCGYTEHNLHNEFEQHLQGVDWQKLKSWYNGYHFCGDAVYNPYDILLFISKAHTYRNYWFETGSPSFLLKLFKQQQYFLPDLDNLEVGEEILDSFDVEQIEPTTLLFQAGYLTIDQVNHSDLLGPSYRLKIPNQEVRTALNTHFIRAYTGINTPAMKWRKEIYQLLESGDLNTLQQQLTRLFASIPWRNFTHNDLPNAEGYYASVMYAFFASLNATIIPEDINNHGQADLTLMLADNIYVIEFKRDTAENYQPLIPNPALEQIQQKGYADKYRNSGKQVFEVGMIFNTHARNLVQMDWYLI